MSSRRDHYKSSGHGSEDLRRKREEENIQLRKKKRDQQLSKKRNVSLESESFTGTISPSLIRSLYSLCPKEIFSAVRTIRKLVSCEPNPPVREVVKLGAIPQLVKLLRETPNSALQLELVWILTNVTHGTTEEVRAVIDAEAVPILINLLDAENIELKEQSIWALSNIAGDCTEFRDLLLQSGCVTPIMKILNEANDMSLIKQTVWTISNLCRGQEFSKYNFQLLFPCVPMLAQMLNAPDIEAVTDTCWALAYLLNGSADEVQAILDCDVAKRLVELLMHTEHSVVLAALRAVGNTVSGNDEQTQVLVNCSVLTCLHGLMQASKQQIRKEACWTISNITAGPPNQIQAVIDEGIISSAMNVLKNDSFPVVKEAAWILNNIAMGGTKEQIKYIVDQNCIATLCNLLCSLDSGVVNLSLSAIDSILYAGEVGTRNLFSHLVEECGGLEKLEHLQAKEKYEIYQKAYKIIDIYFGENYNADVPEDEDTNSCGASRRDNPSPNYYF